MKKPKITDEVIRLYKAACAIEDTGAHERWEEDGGRRSEYLDLTKALHRALGLQSHVPSPLDAIGPPPDWLTRPDDRADWRRSDALAERIEEAIEAAKPQA